VWRKVKTVIGIREWYTQRAGTWCNIAAALGLHDGIWDWSMLNYTADLRSHHTLVEGAIVVVDEVTFNYWVQLIPQSINDDQRAVWEMLQERTVDDTIISWEFKSVFAGSKEVMENILRVIRRESFRWEFCDNDACKNHADHSSLNPTAGLCLQVVLTPCLMMTNQLL
jgi:hypothetical protein